MILALRRHTLLPLDDCLYALQPTIPHLTRSSLHRCLQRHGISRWPETDGDKPAKKKFKSYPIGSFHIDIAEVQTAEGKLYLFVAIDRTSKFAFVELHGRATTRVAADFLSRLTAAVPYKIHTVLTDNGTHFTNPRGATWTPAEIKEFMRRGEIFRAHAFEYACAVLDIDRLTKPRHPWTNGQVERMNRTIKEATVSRYFYETHEQLKTHLDNFVTAYNFGRRLKALKGLTPYEFICKRWTIEPERFILDPIQQMPGLNNCAIPLERNHVPQVCKAIPVDHYSIPPADIPVPVHDAGVPSNGIPIPLNGNVVPANDNLIPDKCNFWPSPALKTGPNLASGPKVRRRDQRR